MPLTKKISYPHSEKEDLWKTAWSNVRFRKKTVLALTLNTVLLISFPFFFQFIEKRNGTQLQDIILRNIPASDVSILIFTLIWSMALLTIIRAIREPEIFLTFVFAFFMLGLTRIISISLVPLNPPVGLIPLKDPLSNAFYGGPFVTKDLFYSGHVATQVLMLLCLKKRSDRYLVAISTVAIAVSLLIQHVHYTIDIVMAPLFAYLCFLWARNFGRVNSVKAVPKV